MLILGVESSCDETAAAVLQDDTDVLSNVINSQIATHSKYGGVVPELASRKHIENIYQVVQESLDVANCILEDIDFLAVTAGPGLIGSLLVGLSFVKAISYAKEIPYITIDHLSGHLTSIFLAEKKPSFPFIALIASGGHSSLFLVENYTTYKLLGRSRDDAAGEAFDKVAKLLDLEYPGGPVINQIAQHGDPEAISFPRAWLSPDSLDFSFSGLKTATANYVHHAKSTNSTLIIEDICASFQEAVVDVLVEKTLEAARSNNVQNIVMGGGVAANSRLREHMKMRGAEAGCETYITPIEYCTDNAAMIALAGYYQRGLASKSYDTDVYSRSQFLK
jgi:N6-L-threonylcarbamoyladenine synthase